MKIKLDAKTFIELNEGDNQFHIITTHKLRIKKWINFITNNPNVGSYEQNEDCYTFNVDLKYIEVTHSQPSKYKVKQPSKKNQSNRAVLEHVLVAEEMLGRKLKPGEVVHHIDGNKANNNIDNLMVFATNGDHMRYHSGSEAYKDGDVWKTKQKEVITKTCIRCGRTFVPVSAKQIKERMYCSRACAKGVPLDRIMTKETMVNLLEKHNNRRNKVIEELGVSVSYFYKLLKQYDIPYKNKRPNASY